MITLALANPQLHSVIYRDADGADVSDEDDDAEADATPSAPMNAPTPLAPSSSPSPAGPTSNTSSAKMGIRLWYAIPNTIGIQASAISTRTTGSCITQRAPSARLCSGDTPWGTGRLGGTCIRMIIMATPT